MNAPSLSETLAAATDPTGNSSCRFGSIQEPEAQDWAAKLAKQHGEVMLLATSTHVVKGSLEPLFFFFFFQFLSSSNAVSDSKFPVAILP